MLLLFLLPVSCAKNPDTPFTAAILATPEVAAAWSILKAELTDERYLVGPADTAASSLDLREALVAGDAQLVVAGLDTLVVRLGLDPSVARDAQLESLNRLDNPNGITWLTALPFSREINLFVSGADLDRITGYGGAEGPDNNVTPPTIGDISSLPVEFLYRGPAGLLIGEEYLPRIDAFYGLDIPRTALIASPAPGDSGDSPVAPPNAPPVFVEVVPTSEAPPGAAHLRDNLGAIARGVPVLGVSTALLADYPDLEKILVQAVQGIDAAAVARGRATN